jgi:hypothetical protein
VTASDHRYKKGEYVMLKVPLRIEQVEKRLSPEKEQQLIVRMHGRKCNLIVTSDEVSPAEQSELNAAGIPARG